MPMRSAGRPRLVCLRGKGQLNLAVLNVLAQLDTGFDIVSIGELERVLAAEAADPCNKIVFLRRR